MLMMKKNKQASTTLRARPRVLFAMGEREINATSMRLLRYPITLAGLGYHVDVMPHDKSIKEQLDAYYADTQGVTTLLLQQEERFWTMRERGAGARAGGGRGRDGPRPGAGGPGGK